MKENLQNNTPETARMEELVTLLNRASEAYYGGKEEIISNYEWDSFFDELLSLEKKTGLTLPFSPTQNVSSSINESENLNREMHEFPALSLAKTKKVEELKVWAGERPIFLSYKLDGLTLVLTYDNGELVKILTRGDGTYGNNITFLKESISGFPLKLDYKGHLVVRGEATISYTDFNEINALMEDDEKYANPRNLASGTLSLDDPLKVKARHVTFNAFTLVHIDEDMVNWGERMDFLKKSGFVTVEYVRCDSGSLQTEIDRLTKKVTDKVMDIPVDGLVICYEDTAYASTGSVTGHHATRAGLAFKWADTSAFSTLKYIEWSCAASTISPVGCFESVSLEGTTVSRASLCNLSEMERLNIGDGCIVEVIKANKIIPKIISTKESTGKFTIPDKCPVCGAPTSIKISPKSNTKTLHCDNPECAAKRVKKFTRFVSKTGFDVDGLSIQTMLKFINMGFISEFDDIFSLSLHSEEISALEGFGPKSVENMMKAIEKSRTVKAINLIYGICIPQVGLDAAKRLISELSFEGFVERLDNVLPFDDIEGIGPERSESIISWYGNNKNKDMLKRLLDAVTVTDGDKSNNEAGSLKGLTFVITGDVHDFKNRDEFKAYVEANGGKVAGSVSGKTAYLVNNDVNSTSSKNQKAKALNVPIISEDEFIQKFGR